MVTNKLTYSFNFLARNEHSAGVFAMIISYFCKRISVAGSRMTKLWSIDADSRKSRKDLICCGKFSTSKIPRSKSRTYLTNIKIAMKKMMIDVIVWNMSDILNSQIVIKMFKKLFNYDPNEFAVQREL